MDWQFVFLYIFGGMLALVMLGLPVPFAFMIVNVIGVYIFWGGETGLAQLFLSMKTSIKSFSLLPIPFFILLGAVLFNSGIAKRAIDVVDVWLGRLPGRLSLVTVGAGIILSTLSGQAIASAAILGSTLVPEMEKRGYKPPMSVGPIMGSGGIAMLIPPSGNLVLLAAVALLPLGKLLIAGILPGLLMGLLYATYIIIRAYLQPSLAPPYEVPSLPLIQKLKITILDIVPVSIIIFLVIGVIFLGIATPSEAAAMGALGAFILALAYRCLSGPIIKSAFGSATRITIMLLTLLLGIKAFSQILAFSGISKGLVTWLTSLGLPPITVIIAMNLVVLALGCVIDESSMVIMLLPLYMPVVIALGFNPIWFAILMCLNVEMGLTTPPFGLILFVMKGVTPHIKMTDLWKAAVPFLICDAIAMSIIITFPQIALWLPSQMMTR